MAPIGVYKGKEKKNNFQTISEPTTVDVAAMRVAVRRDRSRHTRCGTTGVAAGAWGRMGASEREESPDRPPSEEHCEYIDDTSHRMPSFEIRLMDKS